MCGDVVTYYALLATGARAGQMVLTGVSMSELQGWPTPPHWIHLEDDVTFAHTNADTTQDCPEGRRRHSRDTWRPGHEPHADPWQ